MYVLKFKKSQVDALVEITQNSTKFSPTLSQKYSIDKDGNLKEKKNVKVLPGLWLVKDQGVYLMSNRELDKDYKMPKEGCPTAYAMGCNPDVDDDWYDMSVESCGGDDFGEYLPLRWFIQGLDKKRIIKIGISPTQIKMIK